MKNFNAFFIVECTSFYEIHLFFFVGVACDERDGDRGRCALRGRAAARAHHAQPRRVRRSPPHRHVVEHVDVVLLPERVPRPRAAVGMRRRQRHQAARGAAGAAVRRDGARRLIPHHQTLPLHVMRTHPSIIYTRTAT